jgi:hypothetical protein
MPSATFLNLTSRSRAMYGTLILDPCRMQVMPMTFKSVVIE